MKKRFKLRKQSDKILILRWQDDGVLFGPQWECITSFDNIGDNIEMCKTIVQLLNKCDQRINNPNTNDKH